MAQTITDSKYSKILASKSKMGADLTGNKNYKAILDAVSLGEKQHKYLSELSGGEQ